MSVALICDACGQRESIGVCAVPMVPVSVAYCQQCVDANNHPMWVLVGNTACIGGLEHANDEWKDMVRASLKAQGKTLEWFNAEVASDMRQLEGPPKEAA